MSGMLEVKGAATDASASDKEIPTCAIFNAEPVQIIVSFLVL